MYEVNYEVWDKGGVMGMSAEVWRGLFGLSEEDEAYFITVNGERTVFQPHDPQVEGIVKLTLETVDGIGKAHAERLSAELNEELDEEDE